MKLRKFVLILPVIVLAMNLTGCGGGSTEPTVIEDAGMTVVEEEAYEDDSYGDTSDESAN